MYELVKQQIEKDIIITLYLAITSFLTGRIE